MQKTDNHNIFSFILVSKVYKFTIPDIEVFYEKFYSLLKRTLIILIMRIFQKIIVIQN
jgi:hypothetical protein